MVVQSAPVAFAPMPLEWLAFDIETAGGRPEDAEAWMRLNWSPSDKWKPETIGQRYLDMLAKKKERLAIIDASRDVCISIRTPTHLICFHCMKAAPPAVIEGGATVYGFGTEREMYAAFRDTMAPFIGEETAIVGHNIVDFDLRRMRRGFLRNGLQLPPWLADASQPIFDSMREYVRRFSADSDGIMISLRDLLVRIGMQASNHKDLVSGGDVPSLYDTGQFDTIVRYNLLDVVTEAEVFLRMTGRSAVLQ